jgi:hypothetical protein
MRSLLSSSLAIAAVLSATVSLSARADVVRFITQPAVLPTMRQTIIVPGSRLILPPPTVVRTQRMVLPMTTTTTTTLPAVVPVAPTTTTTTTTTVTEEKVQTPDPLGRLHSMMDQINLGESKGMLTADESASLRGEYTRLDTLIQADLVGGLTDVEINDLETQLTLFNQQISNAMQ